MEVLEVSNKERSENLSSVLGGLQEPIATSFYDIPLWLYSLLMEYISYAMIAVSVFGMTSNILIIVIYIKIGFSESINISYCALGLSDALQVTFITWNAICFLPSFTRLNLPFIPGEVVVPTGGASTDIFCQTTAWITAWISVERCLCVVYPFKVKAFVTRRRTLLAIITISFFIIVPLVSLNMVLYVVEFTFDISRNRTILRLFRRNTTIINRVNDSYFIYKALFLNLLPLLVVLVCAVYLASQLKLSAIWRLGHSGITGNGTPLDKDNKTAKRKYNKDMRIAKTVLLIAITYIFLGTLSVQRLMVAMIWSDFRPLSTYGKWYRFTSRLAFLLLQANSSVNFVIYYKMGTKFRQTADQLLCPKKFKKFEQTSRVSPIKPE
ncbi:chemosensory receptor B [Elysia marginata]|uniref:Chemosensory receptor B n=1 Tax=Elysia marginata TaxID=1093978 RepID=A0AAV4GTS6_9GAST|nr:chemosensory receptor B [Elysia marginata]